MSIFLMAFIIGVIGFLCVYGYVLARILARLEVLERKSWGGRRR